MKKLKMVLTFALLSIVMEITAQKADEGVYFSAKDFKNGDLAFVDCLSKKGNKLHLKEIINSSDVKIVVGDSVIKLLKDSLFGYRDNHNTSFRFYNKVAYKIINPTEEIIIYSRTSLQGGIKNYRYVTEYFFSANADAPVYPLSKRNLKSVFYEDVVFHELLDIYFQGDRELTYYDNINKIFTLNRVFELSKR